MLSWLQIHLQFLNRADNFDGGGYEPPRNARGWGIWSKIETDRRTNNKEDVMAFERITVNPLQMGGVPCIRGLRIPVATVVGMIADGMIEDEILKAYPDLEREDLRQALQFAAEAVREREIPLHRS